MATTRADVVRGTVLRFTSEANRRLYGDTAIVLAVGESIARPFGTRTTLVDMQTANGSTLQWPLSWVTGSMSTTRQNACSADHPMGQWGCAPDACPCSCHRREDLR